MIDAQFENLSHFLACYFDQDFGLDGTPDEVIARYIEQYAGRPQFIGTLNQLRQLLRVVTDEGSLKRKLFELGCWYDPTSDG